MGREDDYFEYRIHASLRPLAKGPLAIGPGAGRVTVVASEGDIGGDLRTCLYREDDLL